MNADFSDGLLAGDGRCPPGLRTWNGSDPARRFAVYRNNVVVGLIDALADSFPVTRELVGDEFFRAMAREYVRGAPPGSPVLALYGAGFAGFIDAFAPVAGLPYLGDVARLEFLRVRSFHAADAPALAAPRLAARLADPDGLPQVCLQLHPSVFLLDSPHAVVSLWAAHQPEAAGFDLGRIDTTRAEAALVCRADLQVAIYRIDRGAAAFVGALVQGASFGAASAQALASEPGTKLGETLALLLQAGAITDITTPRRNTA
jgi:hypothetical protein